MSVYEYMNFKRIIPSKYYNARCFTCSLIDLPVIHWQVKWFYMYMLCRSYKLLSSFLILWHVYIVNAPQNLTPFCIHWDTSIFVILTVFISMNSMCRKCIRVWCWEQDWIWGSPQPCLSHNYCQTGSDAGIPP